MVIMVAESKANEVKILIMIMSHGGGEYSKLT